MGFKYTVVCDTLLWVGYNVIETPQEVLAAIKDVGYDGVDLPSSPKVMDGKQWRSYAQDVGLDVPELLGAWSYYHAGEDRNLASPDPAIRHQAIQYARDSVDLAAEVGACFSQLCAAQPAVPELPYPKAPIAMLRQHFKESIKEICEHAAGRGIDILLEPLNCYEGIPGVLTTVIEAVNYCEELGLSNLGVQPDIYHMNISESSVIAALYRAGRHIKHLHVNETNHMMHGTGHANYIEIVRALKAIGYDGYLAFYLPQTTQQIFQSTPGIGYGQSGEQERGQAVVKESLRHYLAQPLRLLKEIEQAVDRERSQYEVEATRY